MLGPEANHYITVSHPENFHWREIRATSSHWLAVMVANHHDDRDHVADQRTPAFHR